MMSDMVYCGECGAQIAATAKFCGECGTEQAASVQPGAPTTQPTPPAPAVATSDASRQTGAPPPASSGAPPPQAIPAAERVEQVAPGAAELAAELGARLQTPGARAALIVGGAALIAVVAAGFLLALLPESIRIGAVNPDTGYVSEALRLATGTTLGSLAVEDSDFSFQLLPLIGGLIPAGAAFVAARFVAPSLSGMRERDAVLWSASGAMLFALGASVLALVSTSNIESELGTAARFNGLSVVFGALVLSGTGAALGALLGGRSAVPDRKRETLPPRVATGVRMLSGPLRGLAVLIVVMTVIAATSDIVAAIDGQRSMGDNSLVATLVDTVVYSLDSGVNHAPLAAFSEFQSEPALSLPKGEDVASALDDKGHGRIFALTDGFPPLWFIPLLVVSIAAFLLVALYSGFASARRMAAPTQMIAVGYGAVTGIVWALGLVILRAASIAENMIGSSVFASVLLVATAAGALGGVLAFRPPAVSRVPGPGITT